MRSLCKGGLAVTCVHQATPDTCLAACASMVVRFYGKKIDELKLYNESQLSKEYRGLCDVGIAFPLIKRGFKVTSYWNGNLDEWGVWTKELADLYALHEKKARKTKKYVRRRNATIRTIKSYLKKGIPVIAEVFVGKFYRDGGVGTHMIVLRGFNEKGFFVCDPWRKEPFVSFANFKHGWMPNSRVGRSLIVIEFISRS